MKNTHYYGLLGLCCSYAAMASVPAGFEELLQEQPNAIEVKGSGGASLGIHNVMISHDRLRFTDPEKLLAQFSLSDVEKEHLKQQLVDGVAWRHQAATETETATPLFRLRYDEQTSQAWVTVRSEKRAQGNYHQIAEDAQSALIHQQRINFLKTNNYQNMSLAGNGALGVFANSYLSLDWDASLSDYRGGHDTHRNINDFYYRHDINPRHYVQFGRMDRKDLGSPKGGSFQFYGLPLDVIEGIRIGSSQGYRDDSENALATPVMILLTQDARVDVYREEQLLGSFYLQAGSHELNTRLFPVGSYPLRLAVYINNQHAYDERVAFTKIGGGQVSQEYFIQAGRSVSKNSVSVAQAGVATPLPANTTATLGAASIDNNAMLEAGLAWQAPVVIGPLAGNATANYAWFRSQSGESKSVSQASYQDRVSLTWYHTRTRSPECTYRSSSQDYYAFGCGDSSLFSASTSLAGWGVSASYTQNRNQTAFTVFEHGVLNRNHSQSRQVNLSKGFRWGQVNTSLSANLYRSNTFQEKKDTGGLVTLSFYFNGQNHTRWLSNQVQNSRYGQSDAAIRAGVDFLPKGQSTQNVSFQAGQDRHNTQASVLASGTTQKGAWSLGASDSFNRKEQHHYYGITGSHDSTLAWAKNAFSLGKNHDGTPASGVFLKAHGESEGLAGVQLTTKHSGKLNAEMNSTRFMPLQGFRAEQFGLQNDVNYTDSDSIFESDHGHEPVFLTPGHVVTRTVRVEKHYTHIGQLINSQGDAISSFTIPNMLDYSVLGGGGFSFTNNKALSRFFVHDGMKYYQCTAPKTEQQQSIRYLGQVVCHPAAQAELETNNGFQEGNV
ncbi:TcfC E-set like domain-containing protein [Mangrovibacter phragmitis]|uniref:TcfC E-set like domain-containing protein n=1 Tax=Mangrovibacter phragmitis TaxID=1691903 RepID=UPI000A9E60E9|nr:TcfC E-set like domain-containing protein [Mangrovibacter phragmitis]